MIYKSILAKTLIWRLLSFTTGICSARLWFGDWHVTGFTIFITILMMCIYYVFEHVWAKLNKGV